MRLIRIAPALQPRERQQDLLPGDRPVDVFEPFRNRPFGPISVRALRYLLWSSPARAQPAEEGRIAKRLPLVRNLPAMPDWPDRMPGRHALRCSEEPRRRYLTERGHR